MSIDPRITRAFEAQNGFPLEPHLIVLALMGSHSHGTYLPPEEPNAVDDVDLMGFVVPPLPYHLGLPRWEHWRLQVDELDVVIYSLDKAVRLLLKSNPNIVGLLWLRADEYVHRHEAFGALLARREIFSSQAAADAFAGYAHDQLKDMEAFDLERMAEYEALTQEIRARGPITEVLEADKAKLDHIARNWSLPIETLSRFRKLHRYYSFQAHRLGNPYRHSQLHRQRRQQPTASCRHRTRHRRIIRKRNRVADEFIFQQHSTRINQQLAARHPHQRHL